MGPKKDSNKGKAKRKTVRTNIELKKEIIAKYESGTSVTAAVIPAGTCTTKENAVMEDILSMGRSMGIEVNREDIDELVEGHSSELTTEELLYLQQQQQQDLVQEQESSEDEDVREEASSAVINDMCAKWGELQAFVEKYHPDTAVSNRAVIIFNVTVMVHFRKIVQKRQKQLTMDRFLKEKRKATAQPDSPPRKRERREKTPEGALPSVIMEGDSPSKE
ncbi:hypothetical protein FHG87_001710 [Trinorchestia longiramus]|nr:hypothetical protein FHG87_001710 [Trinorchestia longiramus]